MRHTSEKTTGTWLASLIMLLVLQFALRENSRADHHDNPACPDQPRVEVFGADSETARLICLFAGRALAELERYGLPLQQGIVIDMVEVSIDNHGYIAYGSYDSRIDRILLMSPAAIREGVATPQVYDEPFDDIHYGGAVAHEVAHAVVQQHLQVRPLSPTPQEYLAHAIQLAVLPAERRQRIIERANVEAWESGDTLADAYMAINQTGFAVKSYLHLTGLADPAAFVQYLLRARWFVTSIP